MAESVSLAKFESDPEDGQTIEAANTPIVSAEDYERGWAIEHALAALEDQITKHYQGTKDSLNALVAAFREMANGDLVPIREARKLLRANLGAWKDAADAADALETARVEAEAAEVQRQLHESTVAAVEAIAAAEPDPIVSEAFKQEAVAIAAAPAARRATAAVTSAPKIAGGGFRLEWSAEIVDVKSLIRAWLNGKCFLDEGGLIEGLQPQMNAQADTLKNNLPQAFPGTAVHSKNVPVTRRRARKAAPKAAKA